MNVFRIRATWNVRSRVYMTLYPHCDNRYYQSDREGGRASGGGARARELLTSPGPEGKYLSVAAQRMRQSALAAASRKPSRLTAHVNAIIA